MLEPLLGADLRRLGRYEGIDYRLTVVRVRGAGSRWINAFAYLPRHAHKAGGRGWDFDLWRARRSTGK